MESRAAINAVFLVIVCPRPVVMVIRNKGSSRRSGQILFKANTVLDVLVLPEIGDDPVPALHVKAYGFGLPFSCFQNATFHMQIPGPLFQFRQDPGGDSLPPQVHRNEHTLNLHCIHGIVFNRSAACGNAIFIGHDGVPDAVDFIKL